ncbi:unnamed protein product [Bursaphelenchus okinawaensis]|uniref:N-acetyltransferase domain-containing protein n=1 Tax=Bursaphelenchus okinawaensis TaxID=465554 RepID=A0A811LLG7_9BILA|nr:unnamed protein product [Bursaphelenchus okinawaensis]CAG9123886.1 unnamed protein product [Bursaphelenchus okinawaensis]
MKATVHDLEVISDIRTYELLKYNPISEHITDITFTTHEYYKAAVLEELVEGLSLIMCIDSYVIGFLTGFKGEVKADDVGFTGFKEDYAEDCAKKLPCPPEVAIIKVIVDEMRKCIKYHVPVGYYYSISRFSIQKDFCGAGLGKALWKASLTIAKQHGFKYVEAECSAVASTKVAESLGLRSFFVFPLERAILNGKPFFPPVLSDGLTGANLVIGEIDNYNTL